MTVVSELDEICRAVSARERFLVTSHVRPDGDAIGSQLALALALRDLGKQVRIVNRDAPPPPFLAFPGVADIEIGETVEDPVDAVFVLECGELERTGLRGLEGRFLINIDHHQSNAHYGAINWFDPRAAACGEMVFELIRALNVPLSHDIAVHIYVAILTDTGSFHFSNITSRTFDICRQVLEAGVDPVAVARAVFDSNNLGRLKLLGAVLSTMELDARGSLAIISVDHALAQTAGATYEDTEGLINLPLSVKEIQAVVFFKEMDGEYRVSMRSKGDIDVAGVARRFGGGGHRNAAGCTVAGSYPDVRMQVVRLLTEEIEKALDRTR